MLTLDEKRGSVTLKVRVQPRASRTELLGEHGDGIKLRLKAPPVDGKANEECRRFLAKLAGVPASSVEIVTGESSRDKLIRFRGIDADHLRDVLAAAISR
ncbi:MAG TPA: DUF167 domain-containing protein [Blastocatellia bacterium]|jgi:uncharacterized protein (TIGR00251 family)|nr:DUF167 domain-containing protein [Blastocatellia bacterium]